MPEAAVCEERDFEGRKNEVGRPWQVGRPDPPSPNAELGQMGTYPALSRRIIRRPYCLHIAAARCRCFELMLHRTGPVRNRYRVVYNV